MYISIVWSDLPPGRMLEKVEEGSVLDCPQNELTVVDDVGVDL